MTAQLIFDDGARWLRITPQDGFAWDEPVAGWALILDLSDGRSYWRHTDGRKISDKP